MPRIGDQAMKPIRGGLRSWSAIDDAGLFEQGAADPQVTTFSGLLSPDPVVELTDAEPLPPDPEDAALDPEAPLMSGEIGRMEGVVHINDLYRPPPPPLPWYAQPVPPSKRGVTKAVHRRKKRVKPARNKR
ncbi:hypothetical protein [Ralstonia phage phiRSL1]|uniref:Uncharacterized protein n=1 Tax=Ralstonia phage phiRSL1 TaxID=1980924 RepID=C4T8X2_9CAUD|nr:hypothetical protein RSL1_ORF244 [Ralstonia phage phiRSL1]BAH72946.1 hypothetical protein [Ralstonia phage phiRSL1]